MPKPDVSIIVVTYNSDKDLEVALKSAVNQRDVVAELVVVDNASTDASVKIAESFPGVHVIRMSTNVGFAAGANIGVDASSADFILLLNPDCRLDPHFARSLRDRLLERPRLGSASGRLLRGEGPDLQPTNTIDSTGIRFTRAGRHFDRGAGEEAAGRYRSEDDIDGPSGAAGFYRRQALVDCKISTGYFDEDFFVYREDADLALRLRKCGWGSAYVPHALAFHRRTNLPERRRQMSSQVNYHSVKNRFLLRINNQSRREALLTLPFTLPRDLIVIVACLTVERTSLPAFKWLWANRRRLFEKRREIARLAAGQARTGRGQASGSAR
jgi:GT2 family glycosyltransferase